MGFHSDGVWADPLGAVLCLLGLLALVWIARRLGAPKKPAYVVAIVYGLIYLFADERFVRVTAASHKPRSLFNEFSALLFVSGIGCACLLVLRNRVPAFRSERRRFLKTSTAALCAAPAAALGAGIILRKDFRINQLDLKFPSLPKDLNGLRILQLSDIHMGIFFSGQDLARVVDASNNLRPDLAFITGDLITDEFDPVDQCLRELRRLRTTSGIWGCMGNHEYYAHLEGPVERKARALDMYFLRQRNKLLRFGQSRLNLMGVDYRPSESLISRTQNLIVPGEFNVLLSHTPQSFPEAAQQKIDLTLAGHTHGGQLNLDLFGTNFNVADIRTPYTKGLYHLNGSTIYVNSGLGTIGIPARLGAPPEITLIRLCNT